MSENVAFEILGLRGLGVLQSEETCFTFLFDNSNISRNLPDVWQQFNTEMLIKRTEFWVGIEMSELVELEQDSFGRERELIGDYYQTLISQISFSCFMF